MSNYDHLSAILEKHRYYTGPAAGIVANTQDRIIFCIILLLLRIERDNQEGNTETLLGASQQLSSILTI